MSNQQIYASVAHELILAREFTEVFAELKSRRIDFLVFKGTALAYAVYSNPSDRPRLDHDLLIRTQDLPMVSEVLNQRGYFLEPQLEVFNERTFHKKDPWGVQHVFDVHLKISNRSDAEDLFTFEELFDSSILIDRGLLSFRAVGPSQHLVLLGLHAVMHHESRWEKAWLEDARLLLSKMTPLEVSEFVRLCNEKEVRKIAHSYLEAVQNEYGINLTELLKKLSSVTQSRTELWLGRKLSPNKILIRDFLSKPTLRGRLRFLKQTLFPPRAYMKYHKQTYLRRLLKAVGF